MKTWPGVLSFVLERRRTLCDITLGCIKCFLKSGANKRSRRMDFSYFWGEFTERLKILIIVGNDISFLILYYLIGLDLLFMTRDLWTLIVVMGVTDFYFVGRERKSYVLAWLHSPETPILSPHPPPRPPDRILPPFERLNLPPWIPAQHRSPPQQVHGEEIIAKKNTQINQNSTWRASSPPSFFLSEPLPWR